MSNRGSPLVIDDKVDRERDTFKLNIDIRVALINKSSREYMIV